MADDLPSFSGTLFPQIPTPACFGRRLVLAPLSFWSGITHRKTKMTSLSIATTAPTFDTRQVERATTRHAFRETAAGRALSASATIVGKSYTIIIAAIVMIGAVAMLYTTMGADALPEVLELGRF
jgi:hypothetical protein